MSLAPGIRSPRRWRSVLAAGATLVEAAVLANHAAGIVVGKFGAATVTADELRADFV
jgi:D-beta-D-heptose 7-phosphate kinase/D-beta-D-heptose 1-phosphate adenosyltransferase